MILSLLAFVLVYLIYSLPIIAIFFALKRKRQKDKLLKNLHVFICTSLIVHTIGLIESVLPSLSVINMNTLKYIYILNAIDDIKKIAVLLSLVSLVYQIWKKSKKEVFLND